MHPEPVPVPADGARGPLRRLLASSCARPAAAPRDLELAERAEGPRPQLLGRHEAGRHRHLRRHYGGERNHEPKVLNGE